MSSDVRVVKLQEFLKVTVQGVLDLESSKAAMAEIAAAAPASTGIDLILDIRESPANLSLPEVVELLAEFMALNVGSGRKTAVVTEEQRFSNAEFFAVSARGRGNEVQAFTSYEGALDWLAS